MASAIPHIYDSFNAFEGTRKMSDSQKTLDLDYLLENAIYGLSIPENSMKERVKNAVREWLQQKLKERNEKIADWGQEACLRELLRELEK